MGLGGGVDGSGGEYAFEEGPRGANGFLGFEAGRVERERGLSFFLLVAVGGGGEDEAAKEEEERDEVGEEWTEGCHC